MLGVALVFSAFAFIVANSLTKPWVGVVGMYGFLALDPRWNWRWAMPHNFRFQFLIFIAIATGFFLNGFQFKNLSKEAKFGIAIGLCYFAWTHLCNYVSIHREHGLAVLTYFWKILSLGLFAVLLVDSPKKLKLLFVVVALGAGYNSMGLTSDFLETGYFRYNYDRSWGTRGLDNNGTGIYFTSPFAVAMVVLFTSPKATGKLIFGLCAAFLAHAYMLLETRGGMLGGLTVVVFIIYFLPKIPHNRTLLILFAAGVISLAGAAVVEEFSSIFASEENRDGSAASRFLLWEAGLKITLNNPIVGVGPDSARFYVPELIGVAHETNNKALHNIFFDVSTGIGIPGFLMFLALYLTPWFYCIRTYRSDNITDPCLIPRLGVVCGLPGYLVASCFSSSVFCETGLLLVATGYCVANVDRREQKQKSAEINITAKTINQSEQRDIREIVT